MAQETSSQGRVAKFFGISAEEHGGSQWYATSTAEFEVIGLGLGRTGTTSLRAALDMLGFGPVHHGVEAYRRPDHRERITEFLTWLNRQRQENGKDYISPEVSRRLRTLFKGYRSTTDAPCCDLVPELITTFPKAKFILSVRDSEQVWWKSWINSMGYHFGSGLGRNVYRALIYSVTLLRRMDDMAHENRVRLIRDWGSIGPQIYHLHNQQVRDLVPQGQLLEYNVKEGWGPLCTFLEVDVPDVPYPKLNEGDNIRAIYIGMQVFGAVTWAFWLGGAAATAYVVMRPERAWSLVAQALKWTGVTA